MIDDILAPSMNDPIAQYENKVLRRASTGKNYLDLHPDIIRSFKYILKTALGLSASRNGKLVFPDQNSTYRIIGLSSEKLAAEKKYLIDKCIERGKLIHVDKDEYYAKDNGEMFRHPYPILIVPIACKNEPPFGVIYLEDKIYSPAYSHEDITLINALISYFVRLLTSSEVIHGNAEVIINFAESLSTLTDELYISRDNLESHKLISEIIRVSKLINSTLDLQNLLESIMESAKLVLRSEGASLMLIDEKTGELYFNVVTGEKQEELKEIRIPPGRGIAGLTAQTKKPIIVNDAQNDIRVFKEADQKAGFFTRNLIACPLLVRNKIIGVLEVINTAGRENFSEDDLELFITFSEQAAIAIHNRELINSLKETNIELRKKVHELQSLHEVSKTLISKIEEKELFDSIVKIIAGELEAQKCSIMLYNESENTLDIVSTFGFELDTDPQRVGLNDSISGVAFSENRLIVSGELETGPLAQYRKPERYETGTCIIYPISHENAKYGVINIAEKINGDQFTDTDIQLVSTIAGQITKAVENFRLLEEMLEKKAVERELEITSSIQKSILPDTTPQSPYFNLGFLSIPAKLMGGDFYDFDNFSDHEFSFLIADVSGKSLPAALFMAVTSSIIRTLNREKKTPGELMQLANDLVYRDSQAGMFVTLFYGTYDTQKGEVRFASAGHNEQMIYRAALGEFQFLEAKGAPLGVLPSNKGILFEENTTHLKENDLMILYTDGIVEAINNEQEEFGLHRFQELLRKLHHLEPTEIVNKIYSHVTEFAQNQPQFDDFTVMIIKAKESPKV